MRKIFFIALIAIWLPVLGISQTTDFGVWTSIGANKKFNKFNIETEGCLRSKSNSEQVDRLSLQVDGSYSIFKPLKVGASYEYMYYNDTKYSDFQNRHRLSLYLQEKQKLGRFSFSLTERIQVTTKDESDRIKSSGKIDTYRIDPAWTWRSKLKAAYNIPKTSLTPALSAEAYYILNDPDGNTFYKLRYTLAFSYKFEKNHAIEIFGLIDKEINSTDPVTTYITGLGYNYSF